MIRKAGFSYVFVHDDGLRGHRRSPLKDEFYHALYGVLPQNRIKVKERLETHTSLHIGGAADFYVTPASADELRALLALCKKEQMSYDILGNGSNLLVSDSGYRGLIISFGEDYSKVTVRENGMVTAQAGVLLSKLASTVAKHGLTGLEFAAGIPGSFGGAVTMNAGAYGGEMKQCITCARVADPDGNLLTLEAEALELGYRTSILQKKNYVLLEADMKLTHGDRQEILQKMQELNRLRREKQPLDQYSAGSTFRRPQGYFAGKLIADSGLSGYQVGGAAVSEKHCGFVINKDHATANDFLTVMRDVIRTVKEKYGVTLEPEVKLLGTFDKEDIN
jgi:UDP-N-acetylmuramate dehydrogenase